MQMHNTCPGLPLGLEYTVASAQEKAKHARGSEEATLLSSETPTAHPNPGSFPILMPILHGAHGDHGGACGGGGECGGVECGSGGLKPRLLAHVGGRKTSCPEQADDVQQPSPQKYSPGAALLRFAVLVPAPLHQRTFAPTKPVQKSDLRLFCFRASEAAPDSCEVQRTNSLSICAPPLG